jgi:DNA-binding NarL/FixJ family response regulator
VIGDEPDARFGLSALIGQQSDLAVCGEAGSAQVAMDILANLSPDLAVVDLGQGTMGGVEVLKGIRALRPHMRVLVVSLRDEDIYSERALRAGAAGYIMRNRPVADLLAAMRAVLAGEVYHGFFGRT